MKREIINLEALDEKIIKMRHECGLDIHIIPKEGFSGKFAYFFTKFGSFHSSLIDLKTGNNIDQPSGIAHFLEHKLFENPENGVFERFSNLGANVNAFTGFEATAYTFDTVDNFDEALRELVEFVQNPCITEENVEKEKGIILQEINMYEDDPDRVCYFNALKNMYVDHPLNQDIAGTSKSVLNTTKENLLYAYENFYSPSNMGILVVGDVDDFKVYNIIDNSLTDDFKSRKSKVKRNEVCEPNRVLNGYIENKKDVSGPIFTLGFKGTGDTKRSLEKAIIQEIVLETEFGRGSDFYVKMYELGILNGTFTKESGTGSGYSHIIFSGESDQIEKAVQLIKDKLDAIKRVGLNEELFELTKRKMIGKFINYFNSAYSLAHSYISYMIKGEDISEYFEILKAVTPERVMKIFDADTSLSTLSVVRKEVDKN